MDTIRFFHMNIYIHSIFIWVKKHFVTYYIQFQTFIIFRIYINFLIPQHFIVRRKFNNSICIYIRIVFHISIGNLQSISKTNRRVNITFFVICVLSHQGCPSIIALELQQFFQCQPSITLRNKHRTKRVIR